MKIPVVPPDINKLLSQAKKADPLWLITLMQAAGGPAHGGEYEHWDKLRHKIPPKGLSSEEWWLAVKFARMPLRKALSFRDKYGRPFALINADPVLKLQHRVDREASGRIEGAEPITNPQTRDAYLVSSLIEEAITSSQLEGASTTRKVAKEMLREGRKPRTHSER